MDDDSGVPQSVATMPFDFVEKKLREMKKKDDAVFDYNSKFSEESSKLRKEYFDQVQKHALMYIQLVRLLQSMRVQSKQREILMKKIEEEAPYMEDVIRFMN